MAQIKKYIILLTTILSFWRCSDGNSFQHDTDNIVFELNTAIHIDLDSNQVVMELPSHEVKCLEDVFSRKERSTIIKAFNKYRIGEIKGEQYYKNSRFYQLPSMNFTINFYSNGVRQNILVINEHFDGGITEERIRVKKFHDEMDLLFSQNKKIMEILVLHEEYIDKINGPMLQELLRRNSH